MVEIQFNDDRWEIFVNDELFSFENSYREAVITRDVLYRPGIVRSCDRANEYVIRAINANK